AASRRKPRPRSRDDVDRRRDGLPIARDRRAAGAGAVLPEGRGGRGPRRAIAWNYVAFCSALPRERGPGAASAAPPPGPPKPALGPAQARPRPPASGLAVRLVSPAARDLPRVPARRLRSPRAAGRDAAGAGPPAAGGPGRDAHALAVRVVAALL